jgi:8-oxo-dGTP diphosphatase
VQPRVGIGVFVIKDGKFLMGYRIGSHGSGTWSTPGGHMEFGENFEETAKREVLEETGLIVDNVRFGAVTNDVFTDENKHYVTVWMLSNWVSGEPTLNEPDKFIDQRWTNVDDIPRPLFLPWETLLKSEFMEAIRQQIQSSLLT